MAQKTPNNIPAWELNPQSIEYLGVSKQPFANEILSEESFFNYQALDKISDSLIHQVQFSDLLLIVEGIYGAGKTAFFRKFIQIEIANTKSLAIQAEATDTLVQIQQKMSLHLQDLGDASHLDDNLKSLKMFDQTPLLVINNSHVLSDTTLQELLRYQQQLKKEQEVSLKILLFANNGMSDTLQKITDIQADQMYVQNLPAFSPKQASAFIYHRLRCAGYFGETLLDDDAIAQLFKTCNGSPLDIMVQATPLIDKAIARILKPDSGLWKKVVAVTVVLTVLGGSGYGAFIYFDKQPVDSTASSYTPERNIVSSKIISEESNADVIDILENDKVNADETVSPIENISHNDTNNVPAENNNLIEATNETTKTPHSINTAYNSAIEPTVETKIEPKIAPAPQTEMQVEVPAKIKPETLIEKKQQPLVTPDTPTKTPVISEPKLNPTLLKLKAMGLRDAVWLLQQNPQNWTLQLLGARDPQTLLKFAKNNNLSSNAAWYKTWLSAKPYYVIVYGSYISRDAARESIANLSPSLRALKPWVKNMKSVQTSLN